MKISLSLISNGMLVHKKYSYNYIKAHHAFNRLNLRRLEIFFNVYS